MSKPPEWEKFSELKSANDYHSVLVHRLRVPGGYLYRTGYWVHENNFDVLQHMAVTFVPSVP